MSRRITLDSSVETLKQEAKDWLKALRANDHDARARLDRALDSAPLHPTLRDVQLAIARELGFAGWQALKERQAARSAAARLPELVSYERMARNLLDAYRTGTPAAMERHWNDTWHRRTWRAMRTYVQLDLGRRPLPDQSDGEPRDAGTGDVLGDNIAGGDVDITLDDARFLVARDQGFDSWSALLAQIVQAAPHAKTPRRLLDRAVRLFHTRFADDHGPGRVDDRDDDPTDTDGSDRTDRIEVESTRDWDVALETLRDGPATGLDAAGQLDDAMLEQLSHHSALLSLKVGGASALTDRGVGHLTKLSNLRELDLSHCSLGDTALSVLHQLSSLETLNLAWMPITDAAFSSAHLGRLARLERVDLTGTATGDGALQAFADKPRLRHFASGAHVTDDGIEHLHEFPVFKYWQERKAKLALLSPGAEPNMLTLRGAFTDRGLARLAGLDGLFALNIDDGTLAITPSGLAPLATLPRLGMLAIAATDDAMPYIAAFPVLRFLMAQDTPATDVGFMALAESCSIEYIWGRRCHNLHRRGFEALAQMPALRGLSVSLKNVADIGLAALPHFPALRELMPIDAPDDGYRHIGKCTELDRLILMYCRDTTDVATSHITGLPKLTKYFASYTRITDRTPELLAGIASLEDVELNACPGVTNAGIAALTRLPRLRRLRLGGMQNTTRDVAAHFPSTAKVRFTV